MLDTKGKPIRIIFRPPAELDIIIDKMMSKGLASTKSALMVELLWLGIQKKGEMIGKDGSGM